MKQNNSLLMMASILVALGLCATPALAAKGKKGGPTGKAPIGVTRQVTLTNPGGQAMDGVQIQFGGQDSADFSEKDNCGKRLKRGDSCIINVTFAPKTAGAKSATLEVQSSTGNTSVALSGTGI